MTSIEKIPHNVLRDLDKLEADVAGSVPGRVSPSMSAPVRSGPMPDYVEHQYGVSRVGALSAEAVVRDYEAAAKEIEAMGAELVGAAQRCEAMTEEVHDAIAYMRDTAAAYREEAKQIFRRIEDCAVLTQAVRKTCETIRQKIEHSDAEVR